MTEQAMTGGLEEVVLDEAAPAAGGQAPDDGVPKWAAPYVPESMRIPRNKQVVFMRFPSAWTDAPDKGVATDYPVKRGDKVAQEERLSRVLICWPINLAEERLAIKRARDRNQVTDELTKQMIRAVDGKRVDWTGEHAREPALLYSADLLWDELGPKCRQPIRSNYLNLHTLEDKELGDFLANCLVVKSSL